VTDTGNRGWSGCKPASRRTGVRLQIESTLSIMDTRWHPASAFHASPQHTFPSHSHFPKLGFRLRIKSSMRFFSSAGLAAMLRES
jgi:hypothetical protein